MKVNLKRSKYEKIKGLTEACIESSDFQMACVIDFVSRSLNHVKAHGQDANSAEWNLLFEVNNSCMEELDRRRGNCFDHKEMFEKNFPRLMDSLNAEDVTL